MIPLARFRTHGSFFLVLICALLGACATTQKSSSGSGDQPAAPISDAQQKAESRPADKPVSSSAAPAATPSPSDSAAPAVTAGTSGGNAAAKPGSPESNVTITDSEEEAQLKRQLAEQDAQINRLRNDQQVETAKVEAEAASAREQQDAAGGNDRQPVSSATAPAAQSNSQEEAAVFPANTNAAEPGGAESGKSAAPVVLEHSVYFDYNQATVADKYDAMLVANAAYLKAHPKVTAEVQGNCDERGSREYNLALGARRAQAVKRALELAGANGSSISAISFGAEKPVALGKDEASYSRNRRADIVY
jgi:peptidoglycan-associated lipoprotein